MHHIALFLFTIYLAAEALIRHISLFKEKEQLALFIFVPEKCMEKVQPH
jgi:hypothetical protein